MASVRVRSLRTIRFLVFAVVLLCSVLVSGAQTSDPIPSGAARTLPALVKAYLDAAQNHRPEAAEALFDLSSLSPAARSGFRKHVAQDFAEHITGTSVADPDPKLLADYAKYHAHFKQTVVKMFKVSYAAPEGDSNSTVYYIGSRDGLFYFICAVQEP